MVAATNTTNPYIARDRRKRRLRVLQRPGSTPFDVVRSTITFPRRVDVSYAGHKIIGNNFYNMYVGR